MKKKALILLILSAAIILSSCSLFKPTLYTNDVKGKYFEDRFNVKELSRETLLFMLDYSKGDYLAIHCRDQEERAGLASKAEEIAKEGVVVILYNLQFGGQSFSGKVYFLNKSGEVTVNDISARGSGSLLPPLYKDLSKKLRAYKTGYDN